MDKTCRTAAHRWWTADRAGLWFWKETNQLSSMISTVWPRDTFWTLEKEEGNQAEQDSSIELKKKQRLELRKAVVVTICDAESGRVGRETEKSYRDGTASGVSHESSLILICACERCSSLRLGKNCCWELEGKQQFPELMWAGEIQVPRSRMQKPSWTPRTFGRGPREAVVWGWH